MMANLFSIFDPSTSFLFNWNWLSLILPILMLPLPYWILPSRISFIMKNIINLLLAEINSIIFKLNKSTLFFIGIFITLILSNLFGLISYTFTSTSHIVMSMSLALPMWLTFIMYLWMTNLIRYLAHFVPAGTPTSLLIFMSLVEMISTLIRPITLAIRLSANMVAGHLLLSLLSNLGSFMPTMALPIMLVFQLLLLSLESAVAVIQSYVFTILTTLYASEACN